MTKPSDWISVYSLSMNTAMAKKIQTPIASTLCKFSIWEQKIYLWNTASILNRKIVNSKVKIFSKRYCEFQMAAKLQSINLWGCSNCLVLEPWPHAYGSTLAGWENFFKPPTLTACNFAAFNLQRPTLPLCNDQKLFKNTFLIYTVLGSLSKFDRLQLCRLLT